MKILVDRITESPTPLQFEVSAEWWSEQAGATEMPGIAVDQAVGFDLEVSKVGADLLVEGVMTGSVAATCSRCVERYRHPIHEELRLVLEPAGDQVPAEPESAEALDRDGMCLGDELEVGLFRGSEILLDAFVSEAIALGLPMQALPDVDERGNCVVCGVDRTQSIDVIENSKPDSPFAVLATLQVGKHEGEN